MGIKRWRKAAELSDSLVDALAHAVIRPRLSYRTRGLVDDNKHHIGALFA